MKEVNYNEYAKEALEGLSKGAFLSVSHAGKDNTMTISWGNLGIAWGKPVFMAMVRYSRHTYRMLERSGEFTISIPFGDNLKKELAFCGSKSGRDFDKFVECGLAKEKAHKVDAPIISGCDLYYECKVIYKTAMQPAGIDQTIDEKFYGNNDNYHVMFYGEIVGAYKGDMNEVK